jgi:hypothetical protein
VEHVNARIIRNKLGLLNLAQELDNVAKACKIMGLSRDRFYRYQAAVEAGGVEALVEKSRRKANQKNRTDESTEAAVVAFRAGVSSLWPGARQQRAQEARRVHLARRRAVRLATARPGALQAAARGARAQDGRDRRHGAHRGASSRKTPSTWAP